jgi:site-specific DNA-methyltransferase (cytosine-N4-specific)
MFGDFLEGFAVFVSHKLQGGFKSDLKGIDLEFERRGTYFVVSIKSGIYWANSDQRNRMLDNFKTARNLLRQRGVRNEIIAVNGCIYAKDNKPFKNHEDIDKQYFRYAGQDFWHFISEDDDWYREIIKPIDEETRLQG